MLRAHVRNTFSYCTKLHYWNPPNQIAATSDISRCGKMMTCCNFSPKTEQTSGVKLRNANKKKPSEAARQNAMCTLTEASLPHLPWCFKIQICFCFWSHCGYIYAWSIPGISAGTGYCLSFGSDACSTTLWNNTHSENNNIDRVHVK